MRKALLIFAVLLFVFGEVEAQNDTIVTYLKFPARAVAHKDSADYIRVITPPAPGADKTLYLAYEYYANGKRKSTATMQLKGDMLKLHGMYIEYYPTGSRKGLRYYEDGRITGNIIDYYPNNKIYSVRKLISPNKPWSLVSCNDSTGKVLAEKGNGTWLTFDREFKDITEQGEVKNGEKEGEWRGVREEGKFSKTYSKGKMVSGIGYDNFGKAYPFTKDTVQAIYPGGLDVFFRFITRTLKYPVIDKQNNNEGKVYITFDINKNGDLEKIRAGRGPSSTLVNEVTRVLNLSAKWIPGTMYGIPAATTYTLPINFSLDGEEITFRSKALSIGGEQE